MIEKKQNQNKKPKPKKHTKEFQNSQGNHTNYINWTIPILVWLISIFKTFKFLLPHIMSMGLFKQVQVLCLHSWTA